MMKNHTFDQTLLPLFESPVEAGFPSPATDEIEAELNLHKLMVKHPAATFFVRAKGDSMIGAHISPGDILVVDRSLSPSDGKIVIALINGEFTVKRLKIEGSKIILLPENKEYDPIIVKEGVHFEVWGVVTYVIHRTF